MSLWTEGINISTTSIAYSKRSEDVWEKAISFAKVYGELKDLRFYEFLVFGKIQRSGIEKVIIHVNFDSIDDPAIRTTFEFFGINDGFMGKKDLATKNRVIPAENRVKNIILNGYHRRPMVEIEMMSAFGQQVPMKAGSLRYVEALLSEI